MIDVLRTGLFVAWTCVLVGCSDSGNTSVNDVPTDAEIKQLVSQAAGMSADTFRQVIESGSANDVVKKSETMPLSLWLLTQDTGEQNEAFSMKGPPNPAKLADALIGGRKPIEDVDYASYVRPGYITKISVGSKVDDLTGVAEFKVPDLYSGRVHFTMTKRDGEWAVAELSMPEKGVAFRCGHDGRWRQVDQQDQQ